MGIHVVKKVLTPHAWVGKWTISLDANPKEARELVFAETKADCASSPWCNMIVYVTSLSGEKKTGQIEKMEEGFRHVVFSIPPVQFEARLSDNLNEMAGFSVNVSSRGKKLKRGFRGVRK